MNTITLTWTQFLGSAHWITAGLEYQSIFEYTSGSNFRGWRPSGGCEVNQLNQIVRMARTVRQAYGFHLQASGEISGGIGGIKVDDAKAVPSVPAAMCFSGE